MGVQYFAFVSDEHEDAYCLGWRIIDRELPPWRWRLIEDDEAGPELAGKRVDVGFRIVGRKVAIASRAVAGY